MMAAELGADVITARTAGLLHDIGKAVDHEVEGPHALIGADLVKRFGGSPKVVHAIAAHHADEGEPESIEAVLVQAADAISGARPGARRETLESYIKRLEALENVANSFERRREVLRHPGRPRGPHHRQAGRGRRPRRRAPGPRHRQEDRGDARVSRARSR